jgi:hypothetical protein
MDAAREQGDEDEISLYEDYSGRGMYGSTTIGIVGPRWVLEDLMSDPEEFRWDSMGLDQIAY